MLTPTRSKELISHQAAWSDVFATNCRSKWEPKIPPALKGSLLVNATANTVNSCKTKYRGWNTMYINDK
eukprot:scaffold2709_cov163-Ochromonas_danica.AAC.11